MNMVAAYVLLGVVFALTMTVVLAAADMKPSPSSTRHYQRIEDALNAAAKRQSESCEICNGTAVYLCPSCLKPIDDHSHENDYICEKHGFVNPIRASDQASINGDGHVHEVRVLR